METQTLIRSCLITFALLLGGCTAAPPEPQISVSRAAGEDIAARATFAVEYATEFTPVSSLPGGIQQGLIAVMTAKGYQETARGKADLLIRFGTHFEVVDKLSMETLPAEHGLFTRYEMEPVAVGSMLINLLDAKSDKLLWKAVSQLPLAGKVLTDEEAQLLTDSLRQAMDSIPSRLSTH